MPNEKLLPSYLPTHCYNKNTKEFNLYEDRFTDYDENKFILPKTFIDNKFNELIDFDRIICSILFNNIIYKNGNYFSLTKDDKITFIPNDKLKFFNSYSFAWLIS